MKPLFKGHLSTNQAQVDSNEGRHLIRASYTWQYEDKGSRKGGLKRGVVSDQDGLCHGFHCRIAYPHYFYTIPYSGYKWEWSNAHTWWMPLVLLSRWGDVAEIGWLPWLLATQVGEVGQSLRTLSSAAEMALNILVSVNPNSGYNNLLYKTICCTTAQPSLANQLCSPIHQ